MENVYGVGVTNKYSLFVENDDDPYEVLQNSKGKKKSTGKENKDVKAKLNDKDMNTNHVNSEKLSYNQRETVAKEIDSKRTHGLQQRNNNAVVPPKNTQANGSILKESAGRRGAVGQDRIRFQDRNENRAANSVPSDTQWTGEDVATGATVTQVSAAELSAATVESRDRPSQRGFRSFHRGGGNMRGRGGRGGGQRREFDRSSGSVRSSVKPMDKRDGGGRGNWGNFIDDTTVAAHTAEMNGLVDGDGLEAAEGQGSVQPSAEVDKKSEEVVEEAEELMTLDEWNRKQEPRKQHQFNIRRAGEGENKSKWKKTYALEQRGKPAAAGAESADTGARDKQTTVEVVETEIVSEPFSMHKTEPFTRGFEFSRGGARGFRGSRGFNSRRARPREQCAPQVNDENFPSLA